MLCESLRKEVLTTALQLPKYNLVWMSGGTVCARDPETGFVVVTPSGLPYTELTPEDMCVTDLNNQPIEGKFRPSVAQDLWLGIFRARPDLNGLVHSHSPYATAFSVINQSIPIITETQADWFNQPIPIVPYQHLEDDGFFTNPIKALADGFAVLLGNHGTITLGKNLAQALERAVTLEEAAFTFAIANSIGVPTLLTREQTIRSFDYYHNRYGQK
jgi:L-ribulose-5-phosphate 4-epimerase